MSAWVQLVDTLGFAALAATSQPQWTWEPSPGCPSEAELLERANELTPASCRDSRVRVRASSTNATDGWKLVLRIERPTGETVTRQLHADSCTTLVDAAIVIVATACPTEASEEVPEPTLSWPPQTQAARRAVPFTWTPPRQSSQPGERSVQVARLSTPLAFHTRFGVRAVGAPVDAEFGLGTIVGLRRWGAPNWAASFAVDASLPRRMNEGSPAIVTQRLLATVEACRVVLGAPFQRKSLSGCGGVQAGAAAGRGVGTPVARTRVQPALATTLGLRGRWWPSPRVYVGGALGGSMSIVRPAFTLDGYGIAWRVPMWSVSARMLIGFRLR